MRWVVKTEEEYRVALGRIQYLMDVKKPTPEQTSELAHLGTLVSRYEDRHYPIDPPAEGEAERFRKEQERKPRKKRYPRYVLDQDTLLAQNGMTDEKDRRFRDRLAAIKRRTGICPDECWDLRYSLALFLVPRLKLFKKKTHGWPSFDFKTMEEWEAALDKMIASFERLMKDRDYGTREQDPEFWEGLDLFHRHMLDLWD